MSIPTVSLWATTIFQPSEAWTLEASDHLLLLKDLSDFGLGFYLLHEAHLLHWTPPELPPSEQAATLTAPR